MSNFYEEFSASDMLKMFQKIARYQTNENQIFYLPIMRQRMSTMILIFLNKRKTIENNIDYFL